MDQVVSRPEGYSATEKLVSWAGMTWYHVVVFVFVVLGMGSVSCLAYGSDELIWNRLGKQHIGLSFNEVSVFEPWVREYTCYLLVIPLVLTGMLVDKIGRWISLLILLLVTVTIIVPLLWVTKSAYIYVTAYSLTVYYLYPSIQSLCCLYAYEVVPLKHRLVSQLALGFADTVGQLGIGLAAATRQNKLPLASFHIAIIVMFVIALVVGYWFLGPSPLFRSQNRTQRAQVYDELVARSSKSSGPRPFSRKRYVATNESFQALNVSDRKFKALIGPLFVLSGGPLAVAVMFKAFIVVYYRIASDFLGGGNPKQVNMVPIVVLQHGLALGGFLISVGLWHWVRDIRFLPPSALVLTGPGAVVCASIPAVSDNGSVAVDLSKSSTITAGVAVIMIGFPIVVSTYRVLTMDLFTTKTRGRGLFAMRAVECLLCGLVASSYEHWRTQSWYFVSLGTILTVVGAGTIAVFYTKSWFETSIIFRDPELDACWLIGSK